MDCSTAKYYVNDGICIPAPRVTTLCLNQLSYLPTPRCIWYMDYNGITWAIIWDPSKAIKIGEWSIRGSGQLERFYCSMVSILYLCDQCRTF